MPRCGACRTTLFASGGRVETKGVPPGRLLGQRPRTDGTREPRSTMSALPKISLPKYLLWYRPKASWQDEPDAGTASQATGEVARRIRGRGGGVWSVRLGRLRQLRQPRLQPVHRIRPLVAHRRPQFNPEGSQASAMHLWSLASRLVGPGDAAESRAEAATVLCRKGAALLELGRHEESCDVLGGGREVRWAGGRSCVARAAAIGLGV